MQLQPVTYRRTLLTHTIDFCFYIKNLKNRPENLQFVKISKKLNNPLGEQAKVLFLHKKPKRNAHFWTCEFKSASYIP